MMIWKCLTVAVCLASAVGATMLYGEAQNEAKASKAALEKELKEAIQIRAAAAKTAYDAIKDAFWAETVTFDTLADAATKLTDAEVAMANTPEEEIAAWRMHLQRTKEWESDLKRMFENKARGAEAKEYYSAVRDRWNAEISLLQARLKAKP